MDYRHEPVLLRQVLEYAEPVATRQIIDGTLGGGGHAAALLELKTKAELLGLDRDEDALASAADRLAPFGGRVRLVRGCYGDMRTLAQEQGWSGADVVLLDLGVSSPQIDEPARGFAHRLDGPLDMRMDRRAELTAATLLNHGSEDELVRIFRAYGEEPLARQIARAVVNRRQSRPWERTRELAEQIEAVYGRRHLRGLPAATRCFQALRIAVNDELGELERGLQAALQLVRAGGRILVITFHSLEDRLVKNFFRHEAATCVCPPGLPVCCCGKRATLKLVTRKPCRPDPAELETNRRAASAKLRVAERI